MADAHAWLKTGATAWGLAGSIIVLAGTMFVDHKVVADTAEKVTEIERSHDVIKVQQEKVEAVTAKVSRNEEHLRAVDERSIKMGVVVSRIKEDLSEIKDAQKENTKLSAQQTLLLDRILNKLDK